MSPTSRSRARRADKHRAGEWMDRSGAEDQPRCSPTTTVRLIPGAGRRPPLGSSCAFRTPIACLTPPHFYEGVSLGARGRRETGRGLERAPTLLGTAGQACLPHQGPQGKEVPQRGPRLAPPRGRVSELTSPCGANLGLEGEESEITPGESIIFGDGANGGRRGRGVKGSTKRPRNRGELVLQGEREPSVFGLGRKRLRLIPTSEVDFGKNSRLRLNGGKGDREGRGGGDGIDSRALRPRS